MPKLNFVGIFVSVNTTSTFMKKYPFLFILLFVAILCPNANAQTEKNVAPERQGWSDYPRSKDLDLYGKVKSVTITHSEVKEYFGDVVKIDTQNKSRDVYTFNTQGDVVEFVDYNENGKPWFKYVYKYDSNRNKIEVLHYNYDDNAFPKPEIVKYKYDAEGNRTEYTSYNNKGSIDEKTIFKYDSYGNIIEIKVYQEDGSWRETRTYRYDSNGNEIEYVYIGRYTPNSKLTYKYNSQNKIIEQVVYTYDDINKYFKKNNTTTYKYNSLGLIIEETKIYHDNTHAVTLEYKYDEVGNLVEYGNLKAEYGGWKFTFSYDLQGNLVEENSLSEKLLWIYNGNQPPRSIKSGDYQIDSKTIYKYDHIGNRVEEISYKGEAMLPYSMVEYSIIYYE